VPEIGIQTGPFGSQLHQSDYSEEGFPVVMPKDIVGSTISTDSIARVPEEICYRLSRHVLQEGDIVLARRGDIGRKSLITSREAGWMCGTGCMRLRPDPEIVEPRFLFTTLGREDVMGMIAGRAQGAIMPNLNLGILFDIPIVLPPASLQQQFLKLVSPIHRQVEVLQTQAEKLRAARDLLLPRLLSGEIHI
jgi:type I restriction enzyme S subunit